MTTPDSPGEERFGCAACCPADPEAAWQARRGLAREAELVDESHYHVMILACRACAQRFLSVFCETIDWADGDDPQSWRLLPLTEAEAAALVRQTGQASEEALGLLGADRRCLVHDAPKGAESKSFWGKGMSIGPHD